MLLIENKDNIIIIVLVSTTTVPATLPAHCNVGEEETTGAARRRPCSACVAVDPCRPYCMGRCEYNTTPQAACLFGTCSSTPYIG